MLRSVTGTPVDTDSCWVVLVGTSVVGRTMLLLLLLVENTSKVVPLALVGTSVVSALVELVLVFSSSVKGITHSPMLSVGTSVAGRVISLVVDVDSS